MQRVLVIENELLLGAGVVCLLSSAPGLSVVGVTPGDEADLLAQIQRIQPHVIVLDKGRLTNYPLELLSRLNHQRQWRLVVVSANDNLVEIYDKHQLLATRSADLIDILHNNLSLVFPNGEKGGPVL